MHGPAARDEELFAEALGRPEHERAAFLDGACRGDAALRERIVALLRAHSGTQSLVASWPVPSTTLHEEKAGDVIGRYKLLQKIGEGGCGVVWMAEQEEPVRRRVALKIIKLGMDTKAVVARFEAERQALAMMDHPNIAKVHDAGSTDTGRPFFVMELVRGIPITKYCDENHLTPTARLELFIKVCQAVQHAHQKGIIHRDLKPSNILVTVNDGAPTPKVIDFGIAKATQGRLTDATVFTAFEQFIGTPVYMSPEQAEMSSLDIDTRTDIYSLGVLLYELLTGRPPFDPKTFAQAGVEEIRHHIREDEPPRPSARLRTLGAEERTTIARQRGTAASQLSVILRGDLDWIVMRCIEKDRTRRYDTANGIAADIQRFLRHEPVVARPPSTAYLVQKLVLRHKLGFVAAGIVGVTLVVGLTVSTVAFLREKNALKRATSAERTAEEGRASAQELLTFVFTDFAEQLEDYGQRPLVQQLGRRAVRYYESLPVQLRTPETQAHYAIALVAGDDRKDMERAAELTTELAKRAPMTPFLRVAGGNVLNALAWKLFADVEPEHALPICERAEELLSGALEDLQWGAWAVRWLSAVLHIKARHLVRLGRSNESIPVFERAMAAARQAERKSPFASRPGLLEAFVMKDACYGLFHSDRRREAREMALECASRWRASLARDPLLIDDRLNLARTLRRLAEFARAEWKDEFLAINRELQTIYEDLIKNDPNRFSYRNSLGHSWTDISFSYHWRQGEFSAAETDLKKGVEIFSVESASAFTRDELRWALIDWATVCAATGRDDEAERHIAEARVHHLWLLDEWRLGGPARELQSVVFESGVRRVEVERTSWRALRDNAERALNRLAQLTVEPTDQSWKANLERNARRALLRAAFEMGDYPVASRELNSAGLPKEPKPASSDIQQRFDTLGGLLARIHVLARGGEPDLARKELARIWPEVDAVFAAGPDLLFNQVQTARALSIRAEIDGDTAAMRTWLERAAGYLRPAAEAGKLTRYQREVLLATIEKQLGALAQ